MTPRALARERDRKRYAQTDHSPEFKARKAKEQRIWTANPENKARMRAKAKVALEVKAGRVVPQPCFICGAKAQAHHVAYDMPLDVSWLCVRHHHDLHNEHRELLRAAKAAAPV